MLLLTRKLSASFAVFALLVGLNGCGGDDTDPPEEEPVKEDAATPRPDAKIPDAGIKPTPDARVEPPPEVTLESLAGKYLLRMDTYGTTKAGTALVIKARVSLLWISELTVDGDKLKATERLCTQVTEQKCENNTCTSAKTVVDPKVISDFLPERSFARTYTLSDDGTFTGEVATAALGYDDDSDGDVPTETNDSRVWDVEAGGEREGMLTTLNVRSASPLIGNIDCTVYGAQKFVSTFRGKLQGTVAKPTLPEMTLGLDGSGGSTLSVTGALACGASGQAKSPVDRAVARMVRYDSGSALDCGDLSDFDKLLPGDAL